MEIELLLTVYLLGSSLFVLSLCRAAARPMPLPDGIADGNESGCHHGWTRGLVMANEMGKI